MGHEEVHGARGDSVVGRTFEQPHADEPLGQLAVGFEVYLLHVHHSRAHDACDVVVARQHDVVDLALLRRETAADRVGARVVGAVVHPILAAGIDQQQPSVGEHPLRVEVVQRLAVLRDDRRERHAEPHRLGDALDRTGDLALDDTRAAHPHGGGVHGVTDVEGILHLRHLLGALDLAHLRDGEHQVDRLVVVQQRRSDPQQRRELQLRFAAVGRQVVYAAAEPDRGGQIVDQRRQRAAVGDARAGAFFAQRGLRPRPDDVVDGEIVAEKHLLARIGVDDARERRPVEAEIVEERRILTEIVGVVGRVVG